LTDIQIRHGDG